MGGKFNLNSTRVKAQQQPAGVMGWPLDSREQVGQSRTGVPHLDLRNEVPPSQLSRLSNILPRPQNPQAMAL